MATLTPRKPQRPVLWIVAGPNGSGKSSLYNRSDIEGWGGSVWIIGDPELMASGRPDRPLVWHRRPPAPLRAELAAAGVQGLPPARASPKRRR